MDGEILRTRHDGEHENDKNKSYEEKEDDDEEKHKTTEEEDEGEEEDEEYKAVMILTYSTINIKRVGVITLLEAALEGHAEVPHPGGRVCCLPLSPHLFLNEGDALHTCPISTHLSNTLPVPSAAT